MPRQGHISNSSANVVWGKLLEITRSLIFQRNSCLSERLKGVVVQRYTFGSESGVPPKATQFRI